MIKLTTTGNFNRTERFLAQIQRQKYYHLLERYGQEGVRALQSATPKDTGRTAASWIYEIKVTPSSLRLEWKNTNKINGVPIALLIQYGHGTGRGVYVQGRDYINPTMKPIFDRMAIDMWREVSSI